MRISPTACRITRTADQPGIYRFQVETGKAGKWALNLGAKVQGEADTVRGSITFDAAI